MNFYRGRKNKTNAKAMIFGFSFAFLSFFIITFVFSVFLSLLANPLAIAGIFSFAVLLISGALSGFVTAKYKGEGGVIPAGVSALLFAIILLGAGLIMTGGKLPFVILINLVSYVALAIFFAIVAARKKKHRRR